MKHLPRLVLIATFLLLTAAFTLAQEPTPTPSPTPPSETTPKQEPTPTPSPAPPTETTPKQEAANPEMKPVETPAEANPAEPKPTMYFYRIKQFTGSALEPSVYCDDKELARMDNGRYFGVTLEPGKHVCRMGDKQTGFEIDVKPDQTYYARITLDMGFWKGRGRLTLMQPEQGAFELKKVKLLGADKVRNRTLVTLYEGSEKKP